MTSGASSIDPDDDAVHCQPPGAAVVVNGVRIDEVSRPRFLEEVDRYVACGRGHIVHFCAAHPTVEARGDRRYREILNRGALNVADGLPVAWAARLSGSRTERLAGTDATAMLARWGIGRGLRHYLYGGRPEVLERLRTELERTYPGIRIVGTESPPFRRMSDGEVAESAERVRAADADVLWIGLGAPKQDLMADRLGELGAAPVILCIGAAFDFLAGTSRRAPRWMQAYGLEWLYRLVAEPRRLWRRYLIGNPRFVAGVVADRVRAARVVGPDDP
jgi:N-acetylglucosaminyldiphosphoundecaprenol N-acetyl-beta-D-mannosaminyltransferase